MAAPSAHEVVRNRTIEDTTKLSDEKIDEFLAQHADNVDLASAEALEYLARKFPYNSVSRGSLSASGPNYLARAATYRALGEKSQAALLESDAIQVGTMTRGGVYPAVSTSEYGDYVWPDGVFS